MAWRSDVEVGRGRGVLRYLPVCVRGMLSRLHHAGRRLSTCVGRVQPRLPHALPYEVARVVAVHAPALPHVSPRLEIPQLKTPTRSASTKHNKVSIDSSPCRLCPFLTKKRCLVLMHSCEFERAFVVQITLWQICGDKLRHINVAMCELCSNLVRLVVHIFCCCRELLQ